MKIKLLIVLMFLGFVFGAMPVKALTDSNTPTASSTNNQSQTGTEREPVKLINPLGGTKANPAGTIRTPQALIGKIIQALLGVIGSLALVMFIFGGFLWMTSAGNPESVKKGRDILLWATLGMVIVFSSYALVRFLLAGVLGV